MAVRVQCHWTLLGANPETNLDFWMNVGCFWHFFYLFRGLLFANTFGELLSDVSSCVAQRRVGWLLRGSLICLHFDNAGRSYGRASNEILVGRNEECPSHLPRYPPSIVTYSSIVATYSSTNRKKQSNCNEKESNCTWPYLEGSQRGVPPATLVRPMKIPF